MGVIDLTSTESELSQDEQQNKSSAIVVVDSTDEADEDPQDHMHAVIDLLRSERTNKRFADDEDARGENRPSEPATSDLDLHAGQQPSIGQPQTAYIPSDDEPAPQTLRRPSNKLPGLKRFPFLSFPPEIRNCVYKILLTTPNAPIELPRPTAKPERARMEKCRNTKKARQKAVHKRIFLEILVTSRQVHDEATGIMYGCNVFKYRSDHRQGPRAAVLPTRHHQLLKHIKIAVISASPNNDQEKWVADLIKCFVKDGINLDTFEMTWYGWQRYILEWNGLVCQALLSVRTEKHMVVKLNGGARMRKTTEAQLEKEIGPERIEIQRLHEIVTGEELDDEDG